ncbi:MAG: 30S ribosomal protein S17 [Patescibacteria group bacterium]|nr:30S ribosomal protein S17 [Patescibacteria group bacterium]MDE2015563.1 30S ribosomal protein S17 [Patescibacteria group bacterium]MDE2227241.1 30S ribosomal protein S17 [Patescibacteria group bacterium]
MKTPEIKKIKKLALQGVVVSDKMQKTRTVAVYRLKKHPKYLKYYKVTTKFKAHDEENQYHVGDVVVMEETRPMSRDKRWRIVKKISTRHLPDAEPMADEDSNKPKIEETSK